MVVLYKVSRVSYPRKDGWRGCKLGKGTSRGEEDRGNHRYIDKVERSSIHGDYKIKTVAQTMWLVLQSLALAAALHVVEDW